MGRAAGFESLHICEEDRGDFGRRERQAGRCGAFQGVFSVVPPRTPAAVAGMVEASGQGRIEKRFEPCGDIAGVCRRGKFVRDRLDAQAGERALDDHVREGWPVRSKDPGHPDDEMRQAVGKNRLLPVEFGLPIPTERVSRAVLSVRRGVPPVENIIGAEVDEPRPQVPGGRRHRSGGERVDRPGLVSPRLALVHVCQARAVDEDIEFVGRQQESERGDVGDIELRTRKAEGLVRETPLPRKGGGEAAAAAQDQDLHGKPK